METCEIIRVWADSGSMGVVSEIGEHLEPDDLPSVPADFWLRAKGWVDRYYPIIKDSDRAGFSQLITELDSVGLELARELEGYVGDQFEIIYFSDGLLREIDLPD